MQKKEINYERALEELESIASKMEKGEFEMDELIVNLKKAQELIKLCKDKLQETEIEIQNILNQG